MFYKSLVFITVFAGCLLLVNCHGSHNHARVLRQMAGGPPMTTYNYPNSTKLADFDPVITTWIKSTGYNGYNKYLSNVYKIQFSSKFVYVSTNSIPSYTIGPWSNPNVAQNMGFTFQIPRVPVQNTGNKTAVNIGHIGIWINGVSMYNADDGQTYNNAGIWRRNAYFFEGVSFDSCYGHADGFGEYHHHVLPVCLFNYADSTKHSPIIGYAFDGYPVYGPFGYTNPSSSTSAIKRLLPSFRLRNITARTSLSNGTSLSASQYGPAISGSYPLGAFLDDFEYVNGLGDLDESNGRFCITPEYPNGTYAYFVPTNSNGSVAYPYTLGTTYYGIVASGNLAGPTTKVSPNDRVITYYEYSGSIKIQSNFYLLILASIVLFLK